MGLFTYMLRNVLEEGQHGQLQVGKVWNRHGLDDTAPSNPTILCFQTDILSKNSWVIDKTELSCRIHSTGL